MIEIFGTSIKHPQNFSLVPDIPASLQTIPIQIVPDNTVNFLTIVETRGSVHQPRNKIEELMENETRGVDSKGNVRYFCPLCNVRYSKLLLISASLFIDTNFTFPFIFTVEYKYLKTHMKECGSTFECSACSLKFKQKRTFSQHMKKKHNVSSLINFTKTNTKVLN